MADASTIKLIVLDIDGVLTDGSIIINDQGIETRRFHVRDGFAIKAAASVGLMTGVISGRSVRAATLRLTYLDIDLVLQSQPDKSQALESLCAKAGVTLEQSAFLGDDLIDLPALRRCGYPMAVADAVAEVRQVARFITPGPGGRGAVRQAIEHLLTAQGMWAKIVERYDR